VEVGVSVWIGEGTFSSTAYLMSTWNNAASVTLATVSPSDDKESGHNGF